MAYGDEIDKKNEESLARQRATRERRAQEKTISDLRKEALDQVRSQPVVTTKDIRKIKEASSEELLSAFGRSSAGGDQRGGIYDLSTDTYNQPPGNQVGQNESIETGIDTVGGSGGAGDSGDTDTFTLDVVKSDNTAGTATFNGAGIN